VHLWSGLVAGPLFVVLGLSGAVLVFRPELEALTGPPVAERGAAAPSLDAVLLAALSGHPRGEARALRVPASPDRPFLVEVHHGTQRIDVAVDPSTLRVVASRAPERSVFAAVHALHGAFHGGRAGAVVVGLLGLWLVIEGLTGLWLYGPSLRLRASAGRRGRSRSVHRLVGAASLAVGVVVGLTGALLALAGAGSRPGPSAPGPPAGRGLARLDAVAARVETVAPGARIVAVVAEPDGAVRVDVRAATTGAAGSIRMARSSGEVVAVRPERTSAWDLVRRLHAGDFAGPVPRIVYAAVALALPVLALTGMVISARRQSSKVLT
jgi:uncharacterized iron-regulated membrane protein